MMSGRGSVAQKQWVHNDIATSFGSATHNDTKTPQVVNTRGVGEEGGGREDLNKKN